MGVIEIQLLNHCMCKFVHGFVSFDQLSKPGPSTSTEGEPKQTGEATGEEVPDDIYAYYDKMDKEEDEEEDTKTVSFEVKQEKIEVIQKRSGVKLQLQCIYFNIFFLMEY